MAVIVTHLSHNSGFPTIASTVHHVKPMGASTAGDCNSIGVTTQAFQP